MGAAVTSRSTFWFHLMVAWTSEDSDFRSGFRTIVLSHFLKSQRRETLTNTRAADRNGVPLIHCSPSSSSQHQHFFSPSEKQRVLPVIH